MADVRRSNRPATNFNYIFIIWTLEITMKKEVLLCSFVLLLPINSMATTIFNDDFSDGNTAGWTFYGNDSGAWSGASGRLNHNAPAGYDGTVEFAIIDGITTPDKFTLEADVSVISSINGSDWGHVGVFQDSFRLNYLNCFLNPIWIK